MAGAAPCKRWLQASQSLCRLCSVTRRSQLKRVASILMSSRSRGVAHEMPRMLGRERPRARLKPPVPLLSARVLSRHLCAAFAMQWLCRFGLDALHKQLTARVLQQAVHHPVRARSHLSHSHVACSCSSLGGSPYCVPVAAQVLKGPCTSLDTDQAGAVVRLQWHARGRAQLPTAATIVGQMMRTSGQLAVT